MNTARGCRGCGSVELTTVLDLGKVPAADYFPRADAPIGADEDTHPLRMDLCGACGLAQLADDDTRTEEPRGVEPRALRDQAVAAVDRVAQAGLLRGTTVREFGSPHGGTWLPLLAERGFRAVSGAADIVPDCFGIMHEPDQHAAFRERAAATAPGGLLLIQYHSVATIVTAGQWNALRHGHFAYYSLSALRRLLEVAGMSAVTAWGFDLYGGTVLVGAVHGEVAPDDSVHAQLAAEAGHTDLAALQRLQHTTDQHATALRQWLEAAARRGSRVYAYGAASRAVALFSLAGLHRGLVAAVADAAPAKHGHRMPGTDIPIIAPAELVSARPDFVLLTLRDLLPEVRAAFPELEGRWVLDDPEGPQREGDKLP